MTAADFDWDEHDVEPDERDDFDDDLDDVHPLKEEPECYACNDGSCSWCQPSRPRWWWFRTKWAVLNRLRRFRYRLRPASRRAFDDEPPF